VSAPRLVSFVKMQIGHAQLFFLRALIFALVPRCWARRACVRRILLWSVPRLFWRGLFRGGARRSSGSVMGSFFRRGSAVCFSKQSEIEGARIGCCCLPWFNSVPMASLRLSKPRNLMARAGAGQPKMADPLFGLRPFNLGSSIKEGHRPVRTRKAPAFFQGDEIARDVFPHLCVRKGAGWASRSLFWDLQLMAIVGAFAGGPDRRT